jgi:hypothetical protein
VTTATANRVIKRALALPKAQKRILFARLWANLHPEPFPPPTLREIKRRAEDLQSGRVKGVSPRKMLSAAKRLL